MSGAAKHETQSLSARVNNSVSLVLSFVRTLALVVITIAVTVFTLQNLAPLEVRFLTWTVQAPSAVIILVIFALGAVFGFTVSALRPRRPPTRPEPPLAPPLELPPAGA